MQHEEKNWHIQKMTKKQEKLKKQCAFKDKREKKKERKK